MLIAQGLTNSVVAAIAGVFAGWLDTRIGSKRATIVVVFGCLVFNAILFSIAPGMVFFVHVGAETTTGGLFPTLPDKVFFVAQNFVAFFVTCGLATARSLMAKLSPPAMLNEFFGLYALSGTATAFLGPLAIGVVTALFHSQRAGVAVGVVFFIIGILGMLPVKEAEARSQA
jgi:UMF1 family MFS transporter